jgi:hypothetical protein
MPLNEVEAVRICQKALVPVFDVERFPSYDRIHVDLGQPSKLNVKLEQTITLHVDPDLAPLPFLVFIGDHKHLALYSQRYDLVWVGLRLLIQGFEDIDAAVSNLGLGGTLGEGFVVPERETERVGLTEK